MIEPQPNACRPVNDGPTGETEFIWTLADGRGLLHEHGLDGCPFEDGGRYSGQAEEAAAGVASEPCPECGEVHE